MKRLFLSALSLVAATIAFAQEAQPNSERVVAETLAKARAYLGADAKLDAVKTLRLNGVLVYGNGDSGTVEVIFKKPDYQQIVSVFSGLREVSTLKRTEAWRKVERFDRPGAWQLDLYETSDILRMQANVRDQFDFMKTPSARVGKIEYLGDLELDGVNTRALRFSHGNGIFFVKYIDPETGRMLRMVNDLGMVYVPVGEKVVEGIRFPEKMITRYTTPLGLQSFELTYTSIVINDRIDNAIFDMPLLAE